MDPGNGLYPIVLLLGAAHGVFLAVALAVSGGGRSTPHLLLACLTLTFAADLGVDYLGHSGMPATVPAFARIEDVTSFLYGPLAWLYVVSLTTTRAFRVSDRFRVHFLPFALSVVLVVALQVPDLGPGGVAGRYAVRDVAELFIEIAPLPLISGYLFACFRRRARHERNVRDQFSSLDRVSLIWLRNLLIALVTLYLLAYLLAVLLPSRFGSVAPREALLDLAIVGVIYTMGFLDLRQPAIFAWHSRTPLATAAPAATPSARAPAPALAPTPAAESAPAPAPASLAESPPGRAPLKFRKSALDTEASALLLQELERFIDAERLHLDSTLTLSRLAEQTGIPPNYVSQAINEHTGSNFFDFNNRYRVTTAKCLLADPEQARANILTIAMNAGFNSKSAFYKAFRQHAGLTPSQFRESIHDGAARTS